MSIQNEQQKITCIIDDDEIYLFSVKKVLESNNLCDKVLEFRNGYEALTFLTEYQNDHLNLPDVIFLDLNMPVMNGWEFLEEFKKIRPAISKDISLYVVSSSVDRTDVEKAKASPAVNDYVTKPVTAAQLQSLIPH